MRNNLSKLALTVGFWLAMAFTSVSAQGVYFDIGLGVGSGTTEFDGNDFSDGLPSSVDEMAVDLGLKVGWGPFPLEIPVYGVIALGGIGHRFYDSYNNVQFNSYLLGPGIIVYPIDMVQLGLSLGTSWVADVVNDVQGVKSDGGFAWEISAAVDLGGESHACLLGIKYFSASNTLKTSPKSEQESSVISIFVRYAFRTKGGDE